MIIAVDFDGTIVTFAVNENHTGVISHTANGYRIACHKLNADEAMRCCASGVSYSRYYPEPTCKDSYRIRKGLFLRIFGLVRT